MKIAFVCGHYMPEMGYLEIHLPKAFASLGNEVTVFTSEVIPANVKHLVKDNYKAGSSFDKKSNINIVRVPATFTFNQVVYSAGLSKAIKEYKPDVLINSGLSKMFPFPILLPSSQRKFKIGTLIGINSYSLYQSRGKNKGIAKNIKEYVSQKIIKSPVYNKAVRNSDKLFLYTPETRDIIFKYIPASLNKMLDEKAIATSLGFDTAMFFFDEKKRKEIRDQLKLNNGDQLFITTTRVEKIKNLEQVITTITELNKERKDSKIHYAIIGFQRDPYSEELKTFIKQQPEPHLFHVFNFMDHETIRGYYSAADLGIWTQSAISILEAMGTGLPIVMEDHASLTHLLKVNFNGWFYKRNELSATLKSVLIENGNIVVSRDAITVFNTEKFSYLNIAKRMLEELEK